MATKSHPGFPFRFTLVKKNTEPITYFITDGVLCGYTGRNQRAVRRHIEELRKSGIAPPASVPAFYRKPARGITTDEQVQVVGNRTSGEAEYFLLLDKNKMYVGLASDHTDRELEMVDVLRSKQVCPAILSKRLWDYADVRKQWDQIEIRSWITSGGARIPYQQGALGEILSPEQLVASVQKHLGQALAGKAILSGTVPLLTDGFVYGERFQSELLDPKLGRSLTLDYAIESLATD